MQNLSFPELDKLNEYLFSEIIDSPSIPDKKLLGIIKAIQAHILLLYKSNKPESHDFFFQLITRVYDFAQISKDRYVEENKQELFVTVKRIKLIMTKSSLREPMTLMEHHTRCLGHESEKKGELVDSFITKNPAQKKAILDFFDQFGYICEELQNALTENLFAFFDASALQKSPLKQLHIARRLIQIGKLDPLDIDLLCCSLDRLLECSTLDPLQRFCDALNQASKFDLFDEAVKATQHLDRETALSFIPFLLYGTAAQMPVCVENLTHLKKSALLDDFDLENIKYFCWEILPIKNVFSGTPEIDAKIKQFFLSLGSFFSPNKLLLELFESIAQTSQGKSLILHHILHFLDCRETVEITMAAFPEGTQDRANFYAALDDLFKRNPHVTPLSFKWIATNQREDIISNLLTLHLTVGRHVQISKFTKLQHLIIDHPCSLEIFLSQLTHPEKLLTLTLQNGSYNPVPSLQKLINLQNINATGIPLEERISFVSSIYAVDPIRGIRLGIQLDCLAAAVFRHSPQCDLFLREDLFCDLTIETTQITPEHIPFIGEEKVQQDPVSLLYISSLFARVQPHLKDTLEKILRPVVDGSSQSCLASTCSLLIHADFNAALEHWKKEPPQDLEFWCFPLDLPLDNPVLLENYSLQLSMCFLHNIQKHHSTSLFENYFRIFPLNKKSIRFLNSQYLLLTGSYERDFNVLLNNGIEQFGLTSLLRIERKTAISFLLSIPGQNQVYARLREITIELQSLIFEAYPKAEFYKVMAKHIKRRRLNFEALSIDNERLIELAPYLEYLKFAKIPAFDESTSQLLRNASKLDVLEFNGLRICFIQKLHARFGLKRYQEDPWKQLFLYYLSDCPLAVTCEKEWCNIFISRTTVEALEDPIWMRDLSNLNPAAALELLKQHGAKCKNEKELKQQAIESIKAAILNENISFLEYAWLEQLFSQEDPFFQTIQSKIDQLNLLQLFREYSRRNQIRMIVVALSWPNFPMEKLMEVLIIENWFMDCTTDELNDLFSQVCQVKEQSRPGTYRLKQWIFDTLVLISMVLEADPIPPIFLDLAERDPKQMLPLVEHYLKSCFKEFVRKKLLTLLAIALKAVFSGEPLEPEHSRRYAQIALNYHIFDHDDAKFALIVSLADNDPLLNRRPYHVYKNHQDAQQVPTLVKPPHFNISGIEAALSLEGLQDCSVAMTVHKSEIFPDATIANWITLRDGLKQRIEQSGFLTKKYSDFSYLWTLCLRLQMYEDLLDFSVDGDLIPPTKAHWAAIVHYLLSLDSNPIDEEHLSQQQKKLYHFAYALTECTSGSRQGIAMLYSKLPVKFKYAAKGLEIGTEAQMRAKFQLAPLIAHTMQSFLTQNERMLSEIVRKDRGKNYFADVHDIDYIKNSVEWLLGLGRFIVFDWHVRGIMKLTRDEILMIVLKHLSPQLFVKVLKEASVVPEKSKWISGEEPIGVLMSECISRSAAFWDFDDEGTSSLNDRGALALLRFLGIAILEELPMITNWVKELEIDLPQNCINLQRQLRESYDMEIARLYVNAISQVIHAKLVKAHPLSILVVNEQMNDLYKLLTPQADRNIEFEKLLKDRINLVTIDMLDKIIEGPAIIDTLRLMDSFEHVLPAATRDLFAEKINSSHFQKRRWNRFKEKLSDYNLYLKESGTFEIVSFQIFCSEANVLLPPGDLTSFKGYQHVQHRFERVIKRIMRRTKKTHILVLNEVKKVYDPLAARFGRVAMELTIT